MRNLLVLLGIAGVLTTITACATDAANINAAQAASYEEAGDSIIGQQSATDMPNVDGNPY